MTGIPEIRFKRLPKWAQHEIERLTADVEYWKAQASAGPENSDTFAYHALGASQPLGQATRVRFVPDRERPGNYIEVSTEPGGVVVRSNPRSLAITPWASNHVRMAIKEDW